MLLFLGITNNNFKYGNMTIINIVINNITKFTQYELFIYLLWS